MNWYKKAKNNGPEYVYHGTSEGAFRNIIKNGLVPSNGKYLYFSNTEQYARSYAQRKGNPYGDRILRVEKSADMISDPNTGHSGDFKTIKPVPPQNIEVKVDDKWVPIIKYVNEEIGILSGEL